MIGRAEAESGYQRISTQLTGVTFILWPDSTLSVSGHFQRGSREPFWWPDTSGHHWLDSSCVRSLLDTLKTLIELSIGLIGTDQMRQVTEFGHRPFNAKTTITLSSKLRFRWSWIFWKACLEVYTTHLNIWCKAQWINEEFQIKSHPIVQSISKNLSLFSKLIQFNSNNFSFANVPTPPSVHHQVQVC